MDFINYWPYDVIELIFQHVSGRECLRMMQVSKSWNEHLERSEALKKIVISPPNESSDLKYLVNSKRKYRHIKLINGTTIVRDFVEIVANPLCEFNTLVVFRTLFSERKQIEQIFLNTAQSLEYLALHYVDYESNGDEIDEECLTGYEFPKLKNLCIEYYNESRPWINRFISNFPKLESITLKNACDEHLKHLILKSSKLKRLTLSGKFYDVNFYKDMSMKFPAQLEEFEFNDILSSSREDENLSYFNAFFTSQSSSLQKFSTDALLELDELESSFKMPNLNELLIKGFHYNVELMDVYLEHMRTKDLKAASLKSFSVHYMNQHLLELLAMNAKNLVELKVAQFHPADVSNEAWFPKLEVLKLFFIDSELRKRLKEKPDEQRTHFEKMIVKAMTHFSSTIQPLMLLHLQPSSEPY